MRDRLVDERGAHVARLEQLRAHRDLAALRGTLGHVEDCGRQLAAARDLVVQVVAPVDLHHVEGDQLGIPGAQLQGRLDDQRVS